mmetsp:Transcript_22558/g.64986  ORF Transcript_22558/g.64986 Transcript_22558/m.64986 type:complete len:564 (+) Transcript_22558:112-1803(+)
MAGLETLKVSVVKASPTQDNSTYQYHIRLQYEASTWELTKRFSEFDVLLQNLASTKYAALPRLPSKTLLGSPTDEAVIAARKEQLRIILNELLTRPDTRSSQAVRQFLALDSHMGAATRSLQPVAVRSFEDARFGVSDFCVAPRSNLIFVTQEDATHLSRLGRVWSVVEPDELGALHLWASLDGTSFKRLFSHTYGIKARCLAWEERSRHLFVGLEDGKIEIYHAPSTTEQPSKKASLDLHHKSPVTHLSVSPRRLLSLGFDTAVRVIDIATQNLLCGGRLMKRLRSEADYLTCGILDDEQDRAFIGTSGGDIFVLDISRNPPNFLHTVQLGSKPISKMCVSKDRLLVATGAGVIAVSYEEKGKEERMSKLGRYSGKQLIDDEVSILSVASAPERDLIFGGFSDGTVAIWLGQQQEALIALAAHSDSVTQVAWVEEAPWGPALFTAGGDGKTSTWLLSGSVEDYVFWSPQALIGGALTESFGSVGAQVIGSSSDGLLDDTVPAAASGGGGFDAFEPTFGVGAGAGGGAGSDVFTLSTNARSDPRVLKGADDSDSEDDIVNAFK